MENKLIFDLEEELDHIDTDGMKLDAVIQLKTWQNKMISLVDKVYLTRLNEIDQLQSEIIVQSRIPKNFHHRIERTVRVQRDGEEEDDDDDDLVIVNVDKSDEEKTDERVAAALPSINPENRVSKILHSKPVQEALAETLTNTITHIGTLAATSTTTIAATNLAKTALVSTASGLGTVAVGMGKMAMGATQKAWSFMTSSHPL